jgi:hypothetical protein
MINMKKFIILLALSFIVFNCQAEEIGNMTIKGDTILDKLKSKSALGTDSTGKIIEGSAGTVTSVSVTTANGVSGSVATATTTPAISLTLGAITPSSVNGVVVSGSSTPTLAVTGTTTVSGSNTGDNTVATSGDSATDFFGAGVSALISETNSLETKCTGITSAEIPIGTSADTATYASLSGDLTMVATGLVTIVDDSHNHTTTTISGVDISDDTNLAVSTPIVLTGDTLSIPAATNAVNGYATSSQISAIEANTSKVTESTTAGRSLTLSTYSVEADAELYTDTKCLYIESPTASDDFESIWVADGQAVTLTRMWGESDAQVVFNFQVDDDSPADVNSSDLTIATGITVDTSLDGDTSMVSGDRLDLKVTSVASTPTWCSVCFTMTKND